MALIMGYLQKDKLFMIMGLFPNEDPQKRFREMIGNPDPMIDFYFKLLGPLVVALGTAALFLLFIVPRIHDNRDEPNENNQRNRIRGM